MIEISQNSTATDVKRTRMCFYKTNSIYQIADHEFSFYRQYVNILDLKSYKFYEIKTFIFL